MELQKFNKYKKLKTIFIVSIIGITLIIGGISLYRTFALYKEEETFNVLQGTIPFFCKENLNGAEPVITGDLVPVTIGDDGTVTKVSKDSKDWYNYCDKKWANAVILTSEGKNLNIEDNTKIDEKYIESYFVWIPKYSYKLFDMGEYPTATNIDTTKQNKAIEIRFGLNNTDDANDGECTTPMNTEKTQGLSGQSGHCKKGDWMTHPAFISLDANGLWVGKFETGYKGASSTTVAEQNNNNSLNIVIKPNQYSWRNISLGNSYTASLNYKKELLSHNMKNTEWGAVAYLTQSKYGRCTDTTCSEVSINSNSSYKTGYFNSNIPYTNSSSVVASTTENYSGIYDLNGGAWEQPISLMLDSNQNLIYLNSELNATILNDPRLYDVYKYNTDETHWERRILGDATGELGPFATLNTYKIGSFFGDQAHFIEISMPFFCRGGDYDTVPGLFCFGRHNHQMDRDRTFRIVLAPQA